MTRQKVLRSHEKDGSKYKLIGIKASEGLRQRLKIAMAEEDIPTYYAMLVFLLDMRDTVIKNRRAQQGLKNVPPTPVAVVDSPLHRPNRRG